MKSKTAPTIIGRVINNSGEPSSIVIALPSGYEYAAYFTRLLPAGLKLGLSYGLGYNFRWGYIFEKRVQGGDKRMQAEEEFNRHIGAEINKVQFPKGLFFDLLILTFKQVTAYNGRTPTGCVKDDSIPGFNGQLEINIGYVVFKECRCKLPQEAADKTAMAFMMRWFALCRAIRHEAFHVMIRPAQGADTIELNAAVLEAVTLEPLVSDGNFNIQSLVQRIKALKY